MNGTQRVGIVLAGLLLIILGKAVLITGFAYDLPVLKGLGILVIVAGLFWTLFSAFAGRRNRQ
jgi:hypothetical protein